MRRPPIVLLAIGIAIVTGVGAGCGDDEGDEGEFGSVEEFCGEAPDIVNGIATIEVLAPGATQRELANSHGIIRAELGVGGTSLPTGTPEADAMGPPVEKLLLLAPGDLDSPEGAKALRTARERIEAFQDAEC